MSVVHIRISRNQVRSWGGAARGGKEGRFDDTADRDDRRPNQQHVDDFTRRRVRARAREIDNRVRKRIHKFRDAARVRLYENYKAINYDHDKLSSRGAIIEHEPR